MTGSKSGFGMRTSGDLAPYISETGKSPGRYHKKLPNSPGPHEKRTPRDTQPLLSNMSVNRGRDNLVEYGSDVRPELVLELKVELMRRGGPIGLASKAP